MAKQLNRKVMIFCRKIPQYDKDTFEKGYPSMSTARRLEITIKSLTGGMRKLEKRQERGSGGGVPLCWGWLWLRSGSWTQIPTDDLVDSAFCRPLRPVVFVFILLTICIFNGSLILFGIGIEKNMYICS